MKFGLDLPNMGACADPRVLADLALLAEQSGWEGVFVWDSVYTQAGDPRNQALCDPWIAMSAMACATRRIRIGPMITPISRRRPWKLARETASLDQLSKGRLTLPVGLGALEDGAFSKVGEELDRVRRAERLDEGLAILDGLWSGEPFEFQGKHFHLEEMTFLPQPVQQPRIPIWVVGAWPRPKSVRRAIRWDGILPIKMRPEGESLADEGYALAGGMTPGDLREMTVWIKDHRATSDPFDIVLEGRIPARPGDAVSLLGPYAEAGATWWLDSTWELAYQFPGELEPIRDRIRQGPPVFPGSMPAGWEV